MSAVLAASKIATIVGSSSFWAAAGAAARVNTIPARANRRVRVVKPVISVSSALG
jgi:hypothetical protein